MKENRPKLLISIVLLPRSAKNPKIATTRIRGAREAGRRTLRSSSFRKVL